MPYIHSKCGGTISWSPIPLFRPKCKNCKKTWSRLSVYRMTPPSDMFFKFKESKVLKKGNTSYAAWADKFPLAATIASKLPKWPKWARILTVGIVFSIIIFGLYRVFTGLF